MTAPPLPAAGTGTGGPEPLGYCKRCLEPTTRPDAIFDAFGVCYPCRYQERIDQVDWDARWRELEEIAAWGRARNVSGYDCIVPVSGGKDSHRQALLVRDDLGLKPLLVSLAYPPEQQSERGAHNLSNLIRLGFDCIVISPGPETWRRLMREGFLRWGNIYKSTELALYAAGPKAAIMTHVPLVFYGENPALSWGSAGGSLDGDAMRMKYTNTLRGGDLTWIREAGTPEEALYWYRYPPDRDLERAGLRIVYLGYYVADFNDFVNGPLALQHGLEPRRGEDAVLEDIGQITVFDALDDDLVMVNQLLKCLKFGFGKASEQASGAIRLGLLSREEALELARRYDGKCAPRYIRRFCEYLSISERTFWEVAESLRNRDLWEWTGNEWRLRYPPR